MFNIKRVGILPPYNHYNRAIKLKGGEALYGPLYNLLVIELQSLREYLDNAQVKGQIRPSTSLVGVPILFIPKKDRGLRLYIDYQGLNKVTKKNSCLLLLISETLDRLMGASVFTKLNLKDAYYRLRIK